MFPPSVKVVLAVHRGHKAVIIVISPAFLTCLKLYAGFSQIIEAVLFTWLSSSVGTNKIRPFPALQFTAPVSPPMPLIWLLPPATACLTRSILGMTTTLASHPQPSSLRWLHPNYAFELAPSLYSVIDLESFSSLMSTQLWCLNLSHLQLHTSSALQCPADLMGRKIHSFLGCPYWSSSQTFTFGLFFSSPFLVEFIPNLLSPSRAGFKAWFAD